MRFAGLLVLFTLIVSACSTEDPGAVPFSTPSVDVGQPVEGTGLWSADPAERHRAIENLADLIPIVHTTNGIDPTGADEGGRSTPRILFEDTEVADPQATAVQVHQGLTDGGYVATYTSCAADRVDVYYDTLEPAYMVHLRVADQIEVQVYPSAVEGADLPSGWTSRQELFTIIPDEPGEANMIPKLSLDVGVGPDCPLPGKGEHVVAGAQDRSSVELPELSDRERDFFAALDLGSPDAPSGIWSNDPTERESAVRSLAAALPSDEVGEISGLWLSLPELSHSRGDWIPFMEDSRMIVARFEAMGYRLDATNCFGEHWLAFIDDGNDHWIWVRWTRDSFGERSVRVYPTHPAAGPADHTTRSGRLGVPEEESAMDWFDAFLEGSAGFSPGIAESCGVLN